MNTLRSLCRWALGWCVFAGGAPFVLLWGLAASKESLFRAIQIWCRGILRAVGIRVVVTGSFPGADAGAFVIVAPHVNIFDPLVMASILPRLIVGVELDRHFRWPVYGRIVKKAGNIPLSHTTPHQTRESMRLVEERLRQGEPLIVFPEGHRTRSGRRGEFGSWIFRVAARTGTKVIPVAFIGAWERNHVGSLLLNPGVWEVRILTPVSPRGEDREAADTLKAEVECLIDAATT